MRAKLLNSGMMPEAPKTHGKVYDASTEEGLKYLKSMSDNVDFTTTAEKEVQEQRQTPDPEKELLGKIEAFVCEHITPVRPFDVAETFKMNAAKAKQVLVEMSRQPGTRIKKLVSGRFCSLQRYNDWDESQKWQYENQQ